MKRNDVDYIINLQGDEPLIDTNDIINLNKLAIKYNSEIATLATQLQEQDIRLYVIKISKKINYILQKIF